MTGKLEFNRCLKVSLLKYSFIKFFRERSAVISLIFSYPTKSAKWGAKLQNDQKI